MGHPGRCIVLGRAAQAIRDRLTSEAGLTRPLAWREVIEILLAREEARSAEAAARRGRAT